MLQTRKIGDITVSRVLEYAAPTHDPAFLFPELPQAKLDAHAAWLAPDHYITPMNRLIVTIQLWIVQAGDEVIIVDTGVGNLKPRAAPRMNQLNGQMLAWLEAAGAAPDKVTQVVHTHLHMDHIGWNTVLREGKWVPTFPKATYHLPKLDYDHYIAALAKAPDSIIDNAFVDSIDPVIAAGQARFIAPGDVVAGLLTVEAAPGHSVGMVNFRLRSKGEEGLFTGDVFHSPLQIAEPTLNTAYCALPEVARQTRAGVLAREAKSGALIMPMHFGAPHCGYIRENGSGFAFEGASWA
jgi:glyoxylase-like metal-dependent hydrolase (beta-lactamase superfamily II)